MLCEHTRARCGLCTPARTGSSWRCSRAATRTPRRSSARIKFGRASTSSWATCEPRPPTSRRRSDVSTISMRSRRPIRTFLPSAPAHG
eukprot:5994450-Prymnesium_polylepis.3